MDPDWPALRDHIRGDVLLPGEPAFEAAYRPVAPRFHHVRPRAVVRCVADADVAVTLAFARSAGLPLAIRSGGHSFEGASTTEGLLLDVSRMDAVLVPSGGGRVRVGGGARLGVVYDALVPAGLTLPAGCGADVGVAGLTLGGGFGVLGRAYGLTCDALVAARVVLADGRVVDCDDELEPELFWALRGGGNGTLGVVTQLVFTPVPAPAMTSFHLTWEPEHTAAVVAAWLAWAPDAPDTMAASLVVSTAADPALMPVTSVFGAAHGSPDGDLALLDAFADRVGEPPATRSHQHGSHRDTKRLLAALEVHGTPRRPDAHTHSRSEFFVRPLSPDTVDALLAHLTTDRRPGEERALAFTPWAGAYNRVAPDATAFPHRTQRFLLEHAVGVAAGAGAGERTAARDWLDASFALTRPYGSGGAYPNFPDPNLDDPARAYFGANAERLRAAIRAYDPDGVFGAGLSGLDAAPRAGLPGA